MNLPDAPASVVAGVDAIAVEMAVMFFTPIGLDVPSLPGEYGDYCLELKIDGTGKITSWLANADPSDFEQEND